MSEQSSRPRGPFQFAADRPVMIADVRPYAKKECRLCHGDGYVVVIRRKFATETKEARECQCTSRRFKNEHSEDVVVVNGALFWKPGKAPPLPGS